MNEHVRETPGVVTHELWATTPNNVLHTGNNEYWLPFGSTPSGEIQWEHKHGSELLWREWVIGGEMRDREIEREGHREK